MSQIPDEKILQQLADGVSQLTPDKADALWQEPVEPADGTEWYLETGKKHRKSSKKRYYLGAVAACLVLCICASVLFLLLPSASVYLDVNPSISLSVNYRNRVTGVTACNEDGAKVLGDLDFRGTDLDVALYAILGSMVHHGYLTESRDAILVSVSCANAERAARLKTDVSNMVSESLKSMIDAGEVLSQEVKPGKGQEEKQFTPGKSSFVSDLEERYPQLKEDSLEDLTVDEIVSILKEEQLDYSDYIDSAEDEDRDENEEDRDEDDEEDINDDDRESDDDDEDHDDIDDD